jgi:hypothetical protein
MKKCLLLLLALSLLSIPVALGEAIDLTPTLPMLNASVTAAKQSGIAGFDVAMKEEYLPFIAEVSAALAANPFALDETIALPTLSAPVYSQYFGVQPIEVITLDDHYIQVIGELYISADAQFVLNETTALNVDWCGTASFTLKKAADSPYEYRLASFVINDAAIEAFALMDVDTDILFFSSANMGVTFCYPAFMSPRLEDETIAEFTTEYHPTRSSLSVHKIKPEDVSALVPAGTPSDSNNDMGAFTYRFEKNGSACYAIAYHTDDYTYLLLLTYDPAQFDMIAPYIELIENAFSLDMLYNG